MRGIKGNDTQRTTITLDRQTNKQLNELMRILRVSRSEVIAYLVEREHERRFIEVNKVRTYADRQSNIQSLIQEHPHE